MDRFIDGGEMDVGCLYFLSGMEGNEILKLDGCFVHIPAFGVIDHRFWHNWIIVSSLLGGFKLFISF